MIAQVVSIGVEPHRLPAKMQFSFQPPYTIKDLLFDLRRRYGVDLFPDILAEQPEVIILFQGRNIFMNEGLYTQLPDQAEVFISVVMSGG